MSEILRNEVSDYFPNAPEQCLACPALQAAANTLNFYFGVATRSATSESNPENPTVSGEDYLASMHDEEDNRIANVARFLSDMTIDENTAIAGIAEQLFSDCPEGALNNWEEKKIRFGLLFARRLMTNTRQCRSLSHIAAFVPTTYTEHVSK